MENLYTTIIFLSLSFYFFLSKILILVFEPTNAFKMHFFIIMLLNFIFIYVNISILIAFFNFFTFHETIIMISNIIHIKRQIPIDLQLLLYEKIFVEFWKVNVLTQEEFICLSNWKYAEGSVWTKFLKYGVPRCEPLHFHYELIFLAIIFCFMLSLILTKNPIIVNSEMEDNIPKKQKKKW